jgi:quinol monooxygenase YgiN
MAKVLSLVTFSIDARHREEFLERARSELKAYWEAHGSERYEVYEEMGPAGPTGRLVEVNRLRDREAYQAMSRHVKSSGDLPEIAYRHVREPHFQVMECRL